MIAALLLLATYVALGLPAGIVLIPWAVLTGRVMPLYRTANWIVSMGLRVAGIRVETQGVDLLPANRACIFMANHISNLDPPALLPQIPGRTSAFVKASLMKIPVLGFGLRVASFVPVSRSGRVESARDSVAAARRVMAQGIHITTFVEGTRSQTGRLLPFKKGPFYLAMETGAPCIPISIWGTETMMRKGSLRVVPGTAHIVFHAPIYPANFATRMDLLKAVRAAIASGLPERMRNDPSSTDADNHRINDENSDNNADENATE